LSTKLKLESVPKSVVDIYYLANTPYFLYRQLRCDPYVNVISNYDAQELINEFKGRAEKPIESMEDMAIVYAVLVAITFKEIREVGDFFKGVQKIKYEWFSDIATLYLSNYKPAPIIQSFTVLPSKASEATQPIIIPSGSIVFSNAD
jgi:hypothetical protein